MQAYREFQLKLKQQK